MRASPAAPHLEQGYLQLPRRMRRGSNGVSFYSGPLLPGLSADEVKLRAVRASRSKRPQG
ncbi:MAG TPA: hypothetical protein VL242_01155 [Sorangium sp.]|nr:hypothetical protein [Sorangium sp.]